MNECGLLEIPEAGDWMDLLAVRYNVLYDNVLYYAATLAHERAGAHCCRPARRSTRPASTPPASTSGSTCSCGSTAAGWPSTLPSTWRSSKRIRLEWFMLYHNIGTISSRPFYLPWVAFREYGDWCDSLGNLLAILTGVADGHRREHILRYMQQVGMAEPYPTKAIYPPIFPGERNWRDYYRSRNLNLPHQYHNGGIWPMIGGFHVAALVRHGWQHQAEQMLVSLAEANRQGIADDWEFNEWMHGPAAIRWAMSSRPGRRPCSSTPRTPCARASCPSSTSCWRPSRLRRSCARTTNTMSPAAGGRRDLQER